MGAFLHQAMAALAAHEPLALPATTQRADPYLVPHGRISAGRVITLTLMGAHFVVHVEGDDHDGRYISAVQISGIWFWACEVLSDYLLEELNNQLEREIKAEIEAQAEPCSYERGNTYRPSLPVLKGLLP